MGKNENLLEELILEILLRLPVKSLQRFKCVSKSWFSLISNPHFAKSHFEIAATPTHKLMLLAVSGSEARSIDLDAPFHDRAPAALKLNFLPPTSYHRIRITGSCNGFLLLSDDSTLFLWNPSTGFHKQLPPSPISSTTSVFTFLYGFGYDESRDDYLVVQASYDDPSDANLVIHFEFFSVRANSWRKIEGAHLPYMYVAIYPKPGSLLNGAIHWLVLRYDDAWVDVIIAFDLMERSFSEIPLPSDFDDDGQFVDLRVLGGCLSLTIDAGDGDAAVIWVMKEYRVQSSWTMTSVEIPVEYFSPVCFTKSGAIVGIGGAGVLVKCNGEGEVVEDCTYFRDRRGCEAAMYTESLLSLPDESGQAAENDRE